MCAVVTLIVVPVLIVYIFLQKNIVKGAYSQGRSRDSESSAFVAILWAIVIAVGEYGYDGMCKNITFAFS